MERWVWLLAHFSWHQVQHLSRTHYGLKNITSEHNPGLHPSTELWGPSIRHVLRQERNWKLWTPRLSGALFWGRFTDIKHVSQQGDRHCNLLCICCTVFCRMSGIKVLSTIHHSSTKFSHIQCSQPFLWSWVKDSIHFFVCTWLACLRCWPERHEACWVQSQSHETEANSFSVTLGLFVEAPWGQGLII